VLIYTDGIVEAEKNKIQFGQRRLNKLIKETQKLQPDKALARIMDCVDEFVGESPQGDDYTMIVLDVKKIKNSKQIKAS
jgi:sigma-B regulation protein RsbU (phosphoserine phosphatase)